MPHESRRRFEFGPFLLDEGERLLTRDRVPIPVTPKVFDILLLLVENSQRLVEKQEFTERLWPDTTVGETTLTRHVSDLRKALQDGRDGVEIIETIPKRGYRLMVPARVSEAEASRHPIRSRFIPPKSLWYAASIGALLLAALGLRARLPIDHPESRIRSVAVLPFHSIDYSGDSILALGLADALIGRLSDLPGIAVRPLSAVSDKASLPPDTLEAGRKLRVDSVLEGNIQHDAGKLRVTARLLRSSDGTALWSGELNEPSDKLFEIEEVLAARVAGTLEAKLSLQDAARLKHRDTTNPEARELYLQGRYLWNRRTHADHGKSIPYFQRAIEADPGYALAYAGLADAYLMWGDHAATRKAAERALDLDPELGEPHTTLALMAENDDYDWAKAEREYRLSIQKTPGHATAHHWFGEFLCLMGRFEEGKRELAIAAQIDPLSGQIAVDTAQIAYFERDYDRSLQILHAALEVNPTFGIAHEHIALDYLMKGMAREALVEGRLSGNPTLSRPDDYWTIVASGVAGTEVDAALRSAKKLEERQGHYAFEVGEAWLFVHNYDRAMYWLERASAEHEGRIVSIKVNPELDPLRRNPRFQALLQRMHL